jgi:hypothetical protein
MRKTALLALAMVLAPAAAAPRDLASLAGEYRYPHAIVINTGGGMEETDTVEDVLRIVPLSLNRAYIGIDMQFVNSHSCELDGVAYYANGTLVYRGRNNLWTGSKDGTAECVLRISVRDGALEFFDDGGTCHANYCSGRGYFNNHGFGLKSRRAIADEQKKQLLSSGSFAHAPDEDRRN